MFFSSKAVFFTAPVLSLLFSTIVITSPLDNPENIGAVNDALILKRQAVDPTNVAPEDETDAEIAADGTGPLRSGMRTTSSPVIS